MDKISILFAKFAGLQKNFKDVIWNAREQSTGGIIDPLIDLYFYTRNQLMESVPELFADLIILPAPKYEGQRSDGANIYRKEAVFPIIQSIDYILEVRANYRVGEKIEDKEKSKRIFISHGKSKLWFEVQAFIEKDLDLKTLELAQERNQGRTVLQKLNEESDRCGYAVIVMTGDDIYEDQVRTRENVMHEIGYFQGKYGLQNVTILHEEGVNIPSNIHGLVYLPFPKDNIESTFGALFREIKNL